MTPRAVEHYNEKESAYLDAARPGARTPRAGADMTGKRLDWRSWTPRRIVRWVGAFTVAGALLMALYGAYAVDSGASPRFFFIYWTVFFALLLIAVALATFDALITLLRFTSEHKKLLKLFHREVRGETDTDSKE